MIMDLGGYKMFYSILQGVFIGLICGYLGAKTALFFYNWRQDKKDSFDFEDDYRYDHWEG